jgi:predicted permease
MNSTLIQMTLIMACGVVWRIVKPTGLGAEQTRLALTTVVYYLFLPAMILEVLWKANIGWQSLQYSLLGISSIVFGIACSWLLGILFKFEHKRLGAMILAAAFPNVTYLGLPVLEQVFGSWARSVVIQIDLFAASPLVYTLGVMIAQHYGEAGKQQAKSTLSFLNAPPFWAAAVAIVLNVNHIVAPPWLEGVLQKLSVAVVPLMLFSLGLALNWSALQWRNLPYILPVVLIKMLMMPLFAIWLAGHLTLAHNFQAAAVLDIAMPSMVLGVVFCDRYHLDSSVYAMMVTVTTMLSLIMLPFWYSILST